MFEYKSIQEAGALLHTDLKRGLTEKEANRRLAAQGPNRLKEPPKKSLPEAFLEQLNDPLVYVLLAAAAISLFLREGSDAVIILAVVLMNGIVGLIQEGKAQRALDALKKLTSPRAYVIRDGREREIPAEGLVTGDLVCLNTGAQVPADLRLISSENLKLEESALTGESLAQEGKDIFDQIYIDGESMNELWEGEYQRSSYSYSAEQMKIHFMEAALSSKRIQVLVPGSDGDSILPFEAVSRQERIREAIQAGDIPRRFTVLLRRCRDLPRQSCKRRYLQDNCRQFLESDRRAGQGY